MIYLLLLQATLGWAFVGKFDSPQECEAGAIAHMELLKEQRSDERHNARLFCVGIPEQLIAPSPVLRGT